MMCLGQVINTYYTQLEYFLRQHCYSPQDVKATFGMNEYTLDTLKQSLKWPTQCTPVPGEPEICGCPVLITKDMPNLVYTLEFKVYNSTLKQLKFTLQRGQAE